MFKKHFNYFGFTCKNRKEEVTSLSTHALKWAEHSGAFMSTRLIASIIGKVLDLWACVLFRGWEWKVFSFKQPSADSSHSQFQSKRPLWWNELCPNLWWRVEVGFSWLARRRKQMIQLIINKSLSKSKPFWQPMTKKINSTACESSPSLHCPFSTTALWPPAFDTIHKVFA